MGVIYIPPIVKDNFVPNGQKNIFFVETSKQSNPLKVFTPLQLCAIESAAYHHPEHKVFVVLLFNNKVMFRLSVYCERPC